MRLDCTWLWKHHCEERDGNCDYGREAPWWFSGSYTKQMNTHRCAAAARQTVYVKGSAVCSPWSFIRRRPLEHLQLALARHLYSHRGRLLRFLPLSISRCVYPLPLYVPLPSSLWRLFKSPLRRAWFASVLSEIVQFNWYFLTLIAVCKIFPWIFIFLKIMIS